MTFYSALDNAGDYLERKAFSILGWSNKALLIGSSLFTGYHFGANPENFDYVFGGMVTMSLSLWLEAMREVAIDDRINSSPNRREGETSSLPERIMPERPVEKQWLTPEEDRAERRERM